MQRKLLGIINVDLDHIVCIRQILETNCEYNEAVHQLFENILIVVGLLFFSPGATTPIGGCI